MTDSERPRSGTRYVWAEIEPDHPAEHPSRRPLKGENATAGRFELEQITIVLEGKLLVRVGTIGTDAIREAVLVPREVMALPPFVPHGFKALERTLRRRRLQPQERQDRHRPGPGQNPSSTMHPRGPDPRRRLRLSAGRDSTRSSRSPAPTSEPTEEAPLEPDGGQPAAASGDAQT